MSADARLTQAPDQIPVRAAVSGLAALVLLVAAGAAISGYLVAPHGGIPRAHPAADLREHAAPVSGVPFDLQVPDAQRREAARRNLERFRWVDRERRVVGIPIEDAMRAVAEESTR